jgi:ribosomal protein S12 methylthiotransferase
MNVFFISLGCDKNLVDSEQMLGLLAAKNYRIVDEPEIADVAVVNTCSFILDAEDESVKAILEMAEYKSSGSMKALIVTGCLAQRYEKDIMQEIPEVDAVLGTNSYNKIVEAVESALGGEKFDEADPLEGIPEVKTKRMISTPSHYAYLKIAEGCAKNCTYCIIPQLRGKYRSVPMEELMEQAKYLASQGVKEIILVAQETTLYGIDLYGERKLPELLEKLSLINGIEWIRLLYCYPEEITDELIAEMKKNQKVCHYLDMPIQHTEDAILKRMGRRTTHDQLKALIEKLRSEIEDIAIRTTLIAGFPGETEEEHEELMYFINEASFDRLGAFAYSQEEGTVAAEMENQIPQEQKEAWRDEIMELQQEITADCNEQMIGKKLRVLIDGYMPENEVYVGRTYRDAPDVDGYIFVHSDRKLMSGDMIDVLVTGAYEYDLTGDEVYESAE